MDGVKKRGRKPKTEEKPVPKVVAVVEPEPSQEKKRRGRKPKSVYNALEISNVISQATSLSDDENVIVRLQVDDTDCEEQPDVNEDHPYAYNRDNYNNISNINDVADAQKASNEKPPPSDEQSLKVVDLLKDFEQKNKNKEWPTNTSICCYWCCNKFDNTPFGIPVNYTNNIFEVYGCFCSLECAAAYNFKSHESFDEVWERYNLINLLSRKIGAGNIIKPAPDRMSLKMFGGFLEIDAFRKYTSTNKTINVNFPPMISLTQQIEEINDYELNNDLKYIPLDHDRINKCREKMMFKRVKPFTPGKSSLESTMNVKYNSSVASVH